MNRHIPAYQAANFEKILAEAIAAGEAAVRSVTGVDAEGLRDAQGYVTVKLGHAGLRKGSDFACWYAQREKTDRVALQMDGARIRVTGFDKYHGVTRKEAYANAIAATLRGHGIPAEPWTRLD